MTTDFTTFSPRHLKAVQFLDGIYNIEGPQDNQSFVIQNIMNLDYCQRHRAVSTLRKLYPCDYIVANRFEGNLFFLYK